MPLFPCAHATHPQWHVAASLVLAQLRAQMAQPHYAGVAPLGLLYITDAYVDVAHEILDFLSAELPETTDWSGTVGVGLAVNNAEYFDEPALAVMLCALPADQFRVFSGVAPLSAGFDAHTALVHADGASPDVADLITEMAQRTGTGYLFGGLSSSRRQMVQFAVGGNGNMRGQGAASGVFSGGLSGVAFSQQVPLLSRVTQGCLPVSDVHTVTAADGHVVLQLDGEPALEVLLRDLKVTLEQPREALAVLRNTLTGVMHPDTGARSAMVHRTGQLGNDVVVRHIIGLDTGREGIALAQPVEQGAQVVFCRRDVQAARADLVRICTEIREELEPEELSAELATALTASGAESAPHPARRIAGAIYVSCTGRGGAYFGAPSAELQIVRRALGDVPLVGFFAAGEIARHHLYAYTGVLTVFTTRA